MPVFFQFTKNGEAENLAKVDDEICEFVGKQPDKYQHCDEYLSVIYTGLSCAMVHDKVTQETLKKYIASTQNPARFNVPLLEEFLIKRYQFKVWR